MKIKLYISNNLLLLIDFARGDMLSELLCFPVLNSRKLGRTILIPYNF